MIQGTTKQLWCQELSLHLFPFNYSWLFCFFKEMGQLFFFHLNVLLW